MGIMGSAGPQVSGSAPSAEVASPITTARNASGEVLKEKGDGVRLSGERVEVGRGGAEAVVKQEEMSLSDATPKSKPSTPLTEDAVKTLCGSAQKEEDESDDDTLSSARTLVADAGTSIQSRRTFLFPAHESRTFKSSSSFFKACRVRLYNQYGVRAHVYRRNTNWVTACCTKRKSGCRFLVRAEKVDDRWVIAPEQCVWEHTHGAEDRIDEEETEGEEEESEPENPEVVEEEEAVVEESSEDEARYSPIASTSAGTSSSSVRWTASTRSSAMRDLVADRDQVFAAQRTFDDAVPQARSEQLKEDSFSHLSATNLVPRYFFRSYKQFCKDVDVPPFPVTSALLALALFAKCSTKDIYYHTFINDLKRVAVATKSVWDGVEGFEQLDELPGERKDKRVKRPRKSAVEPLARKKEARESSSEAYFTDDDKPTRTPRQRKRRASTSSSSARFTSAASDESMSSSDEATGAVGAQQAGGAASFRLIPSPLPPASASFLSFEALYTAYVKHLVPSIGIGCQIIHQEDSSGLIKCNRSHPGRYDPPCPWHPNVLRDATSGRWRIDAATSHLQHNHGPAERLLKDPTWIPIVRNADARKALGLPPLSGSNAKKQKPRIKGKEASVPTKVPSSSSKKRPRTASSVNLISPSAPFSPNLPPFSAANGFSQSPTTPSHRFLEAKSGSAPKHFACLPPHAFQPFEPSPYPSPANSSRIMSSSTTGTSSATLLSQRDLSALLASIHPSFSSLAPTFLTAGVNSFDNLVSLSLMDPEILRSFIDGVSSKGEDGKGGISALQAKLLVKGFRMAGGS